MKKKDASCFKTMFDSIKRIFKSGLVSFKRQGSFSFATVFILVITISLITSFFISQEISRFFVSYLEEKVDISIYFKEEALENNILEAKKELNQLLEIKEVEYISKEKAFEIFSERHKDEPVLIESLEQVGRNPFLASLNIKAKDISQYTAISNFLEIAPFKELISKVDYYQKKPVIEKVSSLSSGIKKGGFSAGIILAFIAIMVTFNQIRLAIHNSKEEVSIMRLVGASNWFIRGPFLAHGIISAVIATLITIIVFSVSIILLNPSLESLMPGLNLSTFFFNNFFTIILIQFTAASGLAIISSLIAIRKFLRV